MSLWVCGNFVSIKMDLYKIFDGDELMYELAIRSFVEHETVV